MPRRPQRRVELKELTIKNQPPAPAGQRALIHDLLTPGLALRITDKGAKSFVVYRFVRRETKPTMHLLGRWPHMSLATARKAARPVIEQMEQGVRPPSTREVRRARAEEQVRVGEAAAALEKRKFEAVAEAFIAEYLPGNRSAAKTESRVRKFLIREYRGRQINSIDRIEIGALLDRIAARQFIDEKGKPRGGTVTARHVGAALRKLMNWYALKKDKDFTSPFVRGLVHYEADEGVRALTDDELRAFWTSLPEKGQKGDVLRLLLMSAQRLNEVAGMGRSEMMESEVWEIPPERYKTSYKNKRPHAVPLTAAMRRIIGAQPVVKFETVVDGKAATRNSDLVFTDKGTKPLSGWVVPKQRIDKKMLEKLREFAAARGQDPATIELEPWTIHDLRRTASTLMARAGVLPHIKERVLGHKIKGEEGVYDRYAYAKEKREALEALGALIDRIVSATDNVE